MSNAARRGRVFAASLVAAGTYYAVTTDWGKVYTEMMHYLRMPPSDQLPPFTRKPTTAIPKEDVRLG